MSSDLHAEAEHDGSVEKADVRDALSGLDVSVSSPVSADGSEVGVSVGDGTVSLSVTGHDGDFTKKSQIAILDALKSVDGVDVSTVEHEGGYDAGDDEEE